MIEEQKPQHLVMSSPTGPVVAGGQPDYAAAVQEANRLAALNPGVKYYIMKPIVEIVVTVPQPALRWLD